MRTAISPLYESHLDDKQDVVSNLATASQAETVWLASG